MLRRCCAGCEYDHCRKRVPAGAPVAPCPPRRPAGCMTAPELTSQAARLLEPTPRHSRPAGLDPRLLPAALSGSRPRLAERARPGRGSCHSRRARWRRRRPRRRHAARSAPRARTRPTRRCSGSCALRCARRAPALTESGLLRAYATAPTHVLRPACLRPVARSMPRQLLAPAPLTACAARDAQ